MKNENVMQMKHVYLTKAIQFFFTLANLALKIQVTLFSLYEWKVLKNAYNKRNLF